MAARMASLPRVMLIFGKCCNSVAQDSVAQDFGITAGDRFLLKA
jgi:hypothetical protein